MIKRLLANLTTKKLVVLSGVASVGFLTFALVSQYGFGLFPCELCIAQRVPYALIVALWMAGMFVKSLRVLRWMAMLCVALFVVDAGIAFYHTAVELHWVQGPSACTSGTEPQTLEEMRAAIMNAALVSCDQPMAHVMGLSMAAWNGIAALSCAVMLVFALRKAHKKAA